jgi:hypothetical protein
VYAKGKINTHGICDKNIIRDKTQNNIFSCITACLHNSIAIPNKKGCIKQFFVASPIGDFFPEQNDLGFVCRRSQKQKDMQMVMNQRYGP